LQQLDARVPVEAILEMEEEEVLAEQQDGGVLSDDINGTVAGRVVSSRVNPGSEGSISYIQSPAMTKI
jgi:hypothetical protein